MKAAGRDVLNAAHTPPDRPRRRDRQGPTGLHSVELKKRLLSAVEDVHGGIPSAERPQRIRAAEERVFALETAEERLVCQALDAGLECHRRIDASPWAILGFVEEAVAEAAE
jgi:hypothetical protein